MMSSLQRAGYPASPSPTQGLYKLDKEALPVSAPSALGPALLWRGAHSQSLPAEVCQHPLPSQFCQWVCRVGLGLFSPVCQGKSQPVLCLVYDWFGDSNCISPPTVPKGCQVTHYTVHPLPLVPSWFCPGVFSAAQPVLCCLALLQLGWGCGARGPGGQLVLSSLYQEEGTNVQGA